MLLIFLLLIPSISCAVKYAVGDPVPLLPMHNCSVLPTDEEVAVVRYCQRTQLSSTTGRVVYRGGYEPGTFDPGEKDLTKQDSKDILDAIEGFSVNLARFERVLVADGDSYVLRLSTNKNTPHQTPDFILWSVYQMPNLTIVFDLPNTTTGVVYYPGALVDQRRLIVSTFEAGSSGIDKFFYFIFKKSIFASINILVADFSVNASQFDWYLGSNVTRTVQICIIKTQPGVMLRVHDHYNGGQSTGYIVGLFVLMFCACLTPCWAIYLFAWYSETVFIIYIFIVTVL